MSLAIPSNFANAVAPFTPAGRQPVGQETAELRESTLKPLEQIPESARRENRRSPDDRPGETDERQRLAQDTAAHSARDEESDVVPQEEQNAREQEQSRLEELKTQQEIRELASRDREVRLHEQAHAALGGRHAGAPRYDYERGPDGVNYAVSGEVPINTSKIPNDPQATIEKAQQIRRAAYAPAEPSDTDRKVAAEAAQMEAAARMELRQEALQESAEESDVGPDQIRTDSYTLENPPVGESPLDKPSSDEPASEKLASTHTGTIEEGAQPLSQSASFQVVQSTQAQRYIDSYRQLAGLGTLKQQTSLGSRLNQLV